MTQDYHTQKHYLWKTDSQNVMFALAICDTNETRGHHSVQVRSVAQLCLTLCNPRDYSTPAFPVLYQLLELAQAHVHVGLLPVYLNSWPNVPSSYAVLVFTALDLQVRVQSCKHRPPLHSTPVLMNKTSLVLLQNALLLLCHQTFNCL